MCASDVAVIVAAAAQAATVILGIGRLRQSLSDVRDDVKDMRAALQSFLVALALTRAQPPIEQPQTKEKP